MLLLFITITTLNDLLLVVEVKTRKTTVTNTVMKGNELWFSLIFFRQRPKRLQWYHLKRREIHLWMRSKIVIQGSDFLNHSAHSQHSTTNKNHIYSHCFDHMDIEKLQKTVQNKMIKAIYSNCKIHVYQFNICATAKGEVLLEMDAVYL